MSTIASSSLIIKRSKESSSYQYNGLKAIKTMERSFPAGSDKKAKCRRSMKAMCSSSAPNRERDPKKRVVVTGMGVVSVFGNDVDSFYSNLLAGVSGITPLSRFDASDYPVRIAGQIRNFTSQGYIDAEMDLHLDDSWRYCLVAGKKALHDANLSQQLLQSMNRMRMGVVIGSGYGGATALRGGKDGSRILFQRGRNLPFWGLLRQYTNAGFMGPVHSISTACATANHCFFAAANHIRRGEADVIVAGEQIQGRI
ncbi:hypothetical protein ACS0TY_008233 [Phlomoides rotata]